MESLWLTFEATMSPDRPTRQAAEERLANPAGFGFGCAGEYAVSLLRFAVAPALEAPPAGALGIAQNDVDVRVAAAVRLKNSHTQALWRDESAFPQGARTAFRDELIGALFRADLNQRVRRLLLAVLQQVHQYDWKAGNWPELLPMVLSVTLSRGAMRLARCRVIVKRLSAVQELGSIDVLCTDEGELDEPSQHLRGIRVVHPFRAQLDQELEPLPVDTILDATCLRLSSGPPSNRPLQPRVLEFGSLPVDRPQPLLHRSIGATRRDDAVRGLPLPRRQQIVDVSRTALEVMVERPFCAFETFA